MEERSKLDVMEARLRKREETLHAAGSRGDRQNGVDLEELNLIYQDQMNLGDEQEAELREVKGKLEEEETTIAEARYHIEVLNKEWRELMESKDAEIGVLGRTLGGVSKSGSSFTSSDVSVASLSIDMAFKSIRRSPLLRDTRLSPLSPSVRPSRFLALSVRSASGMKVYMPSCISEIPLAWCKAPTDGRIVFKTAQFVNKCSAISPRTHISNLPIQVYRFLAIECWTEGRGAGEHGVRLAT